MKCADVTAEVFYANYEATLTPLLLEECFAAFPGWKCYGEDGGGRLVSALLTDVVWAECAVTDVDDFNHPRYYGSEVVDRLPLSGPSKMTSATIIGAAHARNVPGPSESSSPTKKGDSGDEAGSYSCKYTHYSENGGLHILDDRNLLRRSLLALRVSVLRSIRRGNSQSNCVSDTWSPTDRLKVYPHTVSFSSRKHMPLTIQESLRILKARRCGGREACDSPTVLGGCPTAPPHCDETNSLLFSSNTSPFTFRATNNPSDWALLLEETGNLCFTAPVPQCAPLLRQLQLEQLCFAEGPVSMQTVAVPLLLRPFTYHMWVSMGEKGSGTRSHVNVMEAHCWHLLLRGTKKWTVAHPLDKHLLCHPITGEVADLLHLNEEVFPHARHARIFTCIQHAGEALFLPSGAVHSDSSLDDTISTFIHFMDDSLENVWRKQLRLQSVLLGEANPDTLEEEVLPLTTVDVVLSVNNDEEDQGALLLRSVTEFSQVKAPCCDLGARVELESLQSCFCAIGEVLLQRWETPRYVQGVPRAYHVSPFDQHLILYYDVDDLSYVHLKELMSIVGASNLGTEYYEHPCRSSHGAVPFLTTSSHYGPIPNYIPLSVLFKQQWPFEGVLSQSTISLASIILQKAKHPNAFVRPGSVWHYSRFSIEATGNEQDGSSAATHMSVTCGDDIPNGDGGDGWCRTYLFYFSPLLDDPISFHPLCSHPTLQEGEVVANKRGEVPFRPSIVELEWDTDALEEYGAVELFDMGNEAYQLLLHKVIEHECFPLFQAFLERHGLRRIDKLENMSVERVMTAVLWFCSSAHIVGCTYNTREKQRNQASESSVKLDRVCLTASAASTLLRAVPYSTYASVATRISNWLCDCEEYTTVTEDEADLVDMVRSVLLSGTVEEQGIILEVLRIKKCAWAKKEYGKPWNDPSMYRFANPTKVAHLERMCSEVQRKEKADSSKQ